VNIVTEAISREWTGLPVLILRAPDSDLTFELSPPEVSVNLLGSPQTVNQLRAENIRVFIDCTNITEPGEYEKTSTVNVDRGTDVRSAITPPVIQVIAKHILATNDVPAETEQVISTDEQVEDITTD